MNVTSAILSGLMAMGITQAHASEGHASMSDAMRYTPASIKVKRGETIRFRVNNTGRIKHEMVLGSLAELKEHAKTMARFPEMEHDDPNAISVEPARPVSWCGVSPGPENSASPVWCPVTSRQACKAKSRYAANLTFRRTI